jgi:hypothetical protein
MDDFFHGQNREEWLRHRATLGILQAVTGRHTSVVRAAREPVWRAFAIRR